MNYLHVLLLSILLISCSSQDDQIEINSDKIVEVISNTPNSITSNEFSNFNSNITYLNNDIRSIKTADLEYIFEIQNDLISECRLTSSNQTLNYKFSYGQSVGENSQTFSSIKVFNGDVLEQEYLIQNDGWREVISSAESDVKYAIIFDENYQIGAINGPDLGSAKGENINVVRYIYENGNLATIDVQYKYKIDFEYDDKKNPFSSERFKNLNDVMNYINIIRGENLLMPNNYNIFSNANNITSININDYPGSDFQNFAYVYEYNDLDYPTKKTDSNLGLEVTYVYE